LTTALLADAAPRAERRPSSASVDIKQQARALGDAQSRVADADAVTVAGDEMDRRGVALLRLILSAAALLLIYLDPAQPDRNVRLTYATLGAYALYSAIAYFAASSYNRGLPKHAQHWVDVAFHTLLIGESSGTNSLFYFLYFFDILVAAFRFGSAAGLQVTLASVQLFTVVGFLTSDTFELNKFLMRPMYLGVLGYMISYFGGLESRLRKRLTLLKEVTVLSNPRFGVHQTITTALEKLRELYDADSCLLVIAGDTDVEHCLYQARRGEPAYGGTPDSCAPEMAAVLLAPPFTHAMLVDQGAGWWRNGVYVHVTDVTTRRTVHTLPESTRMVASALDAEAIASVPFRYHNDAVGRLYLTGRSRAFDTSDLEFLSHAIYTMVRVTDNVRLVDNLAYNAADNERRRIARGIHDTVIQPLVGLQIGLRAILQQMDDSGYRAETDIKHLVESIDCEVSRLRQYMTVLRGERRNEFMPAIRRFAREFRRLTGIEVDVVGPTELSVNEMVCVALFGMTAEALSNIRRHTTSLHAAVVVERVEDRIEFRVENDATEGEAQPFNPKSLGEHAEALGGKLEIRRSPGKTAVAVIVPL